MSTTLPFPVFGLEEAEIESFIDNYEILKKKFQATFREPIKLDIEKFHSSKEYVSCEIRESIELSLNLTECFVHYVDVEYEHIGSKGARYRSTEFHCWGSVVVLPFEMTFAICLKSRPFVLRSIIKWLLFSSKLVLHSKIAVVETFFAS